MIGRGWDKEAKERLEAKRKCCVCDAQLTTYGGPPQSNKRYCSAKCRAAAYYRRKHVVQQTKPKPCRGCRRPFAPKKPNFIYCPTCFIRRIYPSRHRLDDYQA